MKKVYLLIYNDLLGSREEIKVVLNEIPEVSTWRYDMPNMFYIISEYSSKEIALKIREHFPIKGKFIITEITNNYYGWLDSDSWYLLQNKAHKPK